jgi:hypothetical protein
MFWDKATTNCPALFVPPQLPRPGVYQVPYEPKGQCREQKVTKKDAYPARVCGTLLQRHPFGCRYRSGKDGEDEREQREEDPSEMVHREVRDVCS